MELHFFQPSAKLASFQHTESITQSLTVVKPPTSYLNACSALRPAPDLETMLIHQLAFVLKLQSCKITKVCLVFFVWLVFCLLNACLLFHFSFFTLEW